MADELVPIRHCPEPHCRGVLFARRRALTMLCACDRTSCQKLFIVSLAFGIIERFHGAPLWHQRIAIASSRYAQWLVAHEEARCAALAIGIKGMDKERTRILGTSNAGILDQSEILVLLDAVEGTKAPAEKKGNIIPMRRTA